MRVDIYFWLAAARSRKKHFYFVLPAIAVILALQTHCVGEHRQVTEVGLEKQLFVDDLLIAEKKNITLVMNPPAKTGERCIVPDRPWENFMMGLGQVIEDQDCYKMWYEALSIYGAKVRGYLCYATSQDGIHWTKPNLGIFEFEGSKNNNILLSGISGTVFIDPKESDGCRFKLAARWKDRDDGDGLWIFSSPDGLHWKPFVDHAVLSKKNDFDTQNQVFWDDELCKYVAYVRRWEEVPSAILKRLRRIGRSETDNLARWPEGKVVFRSDEQDPWESDHYNPCVHKYPHAPHLYLMFPSSYFHFPGTLDDGAVDIQMDVSRDGLHWPRLERRAYVRRGIQGEFDGGGVYMSVGMLRKDNELWMYYTGYDFTHGKYDVQTTRNKGVISRLVQRLDGFLSADASYSGGSLTTVPLRFKGSELRLNLDTAALGAVWVELLDEQGRVLPGFGKDDCYLINGNFTAYRVAWRGKADINEFAGDVLRLRFIMRNAKLYAFQFCRNAG